MKLTLKSLKISNFKGIKELFIPVKLIANIQGDNATGKTTIFDAFTWLLFDKDSQDRSVFEIKPLDKQNNPIHYLETVVTGDFDIDGKPIRLDKIFKEKWVKRRGQAEQEFSGHETTYYIDGIPSKKAEYQKFISNLLDEKTFKLLTSPFAFEAMKWQDKRNSLFEICGDVSDVEVINSKTRLEPLLGKDIEVVKRSIAATKKKLKTDIENIPPRIDELTKSVQAIDVVNVKHGVKVKEEELQTLEKQLEANDVIYQEIRAKQKKLMELEKSKSVLEEQLNKQENEQLFTLKSTLQNKQFDLRTNQNKLTNLQNASKTLESEIVALDQEIKQLRLDYTDELKKELHIDLECTCPTCKQQLPEDMMAHQAEALTKNFEIEKQKKLVAINAKGRTKKTAYDMKSKEIESNVSLVRQIQGIIEQQQSEINLYEEQINNFEPQKLKSGELEELLVRIVTLSEEIESSIVPDTTVLKTKKIEIIEELDQLKGKLTEANIQEGTKLRIEELKQHLKDLSIKLADTEQEEFLCEEFTKTKIDMLEERINSRFKYVTFKLFSEQVNGGIAECCESLIEGVPFSNANNAAKINAGLDIINTLTNYYNFSAPIFVDNAESVNELIATNSQVIRLIVSKDKELVVEQ